MKLKLKMHGYMKVEVVFKKMNLTWQKKLKYCE